MITDKEKRILETLNIFIENKGMISDLEIAEILSKNNIKTSKTTVGRDLSENIVELFKKYNKKNKINNNYHDLTDEQISIIAFIKKKRKDNKHLGQVKGGENRQEKKRSYEV